MSTRRTDQVSRKTKPTLGEPASSFVLVIRVLRFVIVGASAFILDAGFVEIVTRAIDISPIAARLPGFVLVTIYTWLLNRQFTFQTGRSVSLGEFVAYASGTGVGLAINYLVFSLAVLLSPTMRFQPTLAVALGTTFAMMFNFVFYDRLYRDRPDPDTSRPM